MLFLVLFCPADVTCFERNSMHTYKNRSIRISRAITNFYEAGPMSPPLDKILKCMVGTSLVLQWLRLHAPSARDMGSIPCRGTKISSAIQSIQKRKGKGKKRNMEEWILAYRKFKVLIGNWSKKEQKRQLWFGTKLQGTDMNNCGYLYRRRQRGLLQLEKASLGQQDLRCWEAWSRQSPGRSSGGNSEPPTKVTVSADCPSTC